MGKRHNRKRTRSRPRHRDAGPARSTHIRTYSMDTEASYASSLASNPAFLPPSSSYYPLATRPQDQWNHWDKMYSAWQTRNQLRQQQEQQALEEAQRLRFFGGEAGEELSLLEPMLRVVTALFDGETDYVDP